MLLNATESILKHTSNFLTNSFLKKKEKENKQTTPLKKKTLREFAASKPAFKEILWTERKW